MRGWIMALPCVALASAAVGQAVPPTLASASPPFAVGAFRSELAGDDKVGRRRAGLVCAPAGALRWRDVEPVAGRAIGAAARAIRAGGVAVDAPDPDDWIGTRAPVTGTRLIGNIVAMRASLCAPAYGPGRTLDGVRRLKGEGRMRIEWRVYRLADHQVVARTETCAAYAFDRSGMTPSDVGELGVVENARVLGDALARSPDASGLPASLIAAGDDCPARATPRRTPDGSAAEP